MTRSRACWRVLSNEAETTHTSCQDMNTRPGAVVHWRNLGLTFSNPIFFTPVRSNMVAKSMILTGCTQQQSQ